MSLSADRVLRDQYTAVQGAYRSHLQVPSAWPPVGVNSCCSMAACVLCRWCLWLCCFTVTGTAPAQMQGHVCVCT